MRALVVAVTAGLLLSGCASYVTPGGPASLELVDRADIADTLARQPAARFPARIAIVRVQAPDYSSYSSDGYGNGAYSVVSTRELIDEAGIDLISDWPEVAGVAPINALLVPAELETLDDLRIAAAKTQADVLIIHTVDTTFRIKGRGYAALAPISLGLVPDRDAYVTATASALVIDVKTGFLYGLAEATSRTSGLTSIWGQIRRIDEKRLEAERLAIGELLGELDTTWRGIVAQNR
jgi:hypothetical protein